jgi:hypothetical protein
VLRHSFAGDKGVRGLHTAQLVLHYLPFNNAEAFPDLSIEEALVAPGDPEGTLSAILVCQNLGIPVPASPSPALHPSFALLQAEDGPLLRRKARGDLMSFHPGEMMERKRIKLKNPKPGIFRRLFRRD